jgi:hypothetical protein
MLPSYGKDRCTRIEFRCTTCNLYQNTSRALGAGSSHARVRAAPRGSNNSTA